MPAPSVTLRPYRPSDFETLHAIDQACFSKAIAYGRQELKAYLRHPGAWCTVAEVGEAEKAMAARQGTAAPSEPAPGTIGGFILTERVREFAHIITLDVLDAYRRQSVGSLLLDAAEREAASHAAEWMYLETATTNKPAIALWKKHGYRETGTIRNFYGRGQDAFEMRKRLGAESRNEVSG